MELVKDGEAVADGNAELLRVVDCDRETLRDPDRVTDDDAERVDDVVADDDSDAVLDAELLDDGDTVTDGDGAMHSAAP